MILLSHWKDHDTPRTYICWLSNQTCDLLKLPDVLQQRLRQRPHAIAQMLELGAFYAQQPAMAVLLADRVLNENLTVTAIRKLVREAIPPASGAAPDREETHNHRANATLVQDVTTNSHQVQHVAPIEEEPCEDLREEASEVLIFLASRAEELPLGMISEQILDKIETALKELRRSFARRAPETQLDIANADS